MQEKGPERFILTKSYEIAYALFRIADSMQAGDLAGKLRTGGSELLELVAGEHYSESLLSLQTLEVLVKFSGDVNAMSSANCDILMREVYALEAAIVQQRNAGKTDSIDLSEIFSKEEPKTVEEVFRNHSSNHASRFGNGIAAAPSEESETFTAASPSDIRMYPDVPVTKEIAKSPVRQAAILEKIRQSGNCRMKDIQEILPECSERTLRYDLQSLVEQNLIERIGTGGPAVSYRMRQTVA